jgi:hypothetical protein
MSMIGNPWLRAFRDTALRAVARRPGSVSRLAGMMQQEDPVDLHRTVAQRRSDAGAAR